MKKMRFLLSLLLSFAVAANCYAAPRYTIEDGTGSETGTTENPLKVSLTGGILSSTSSGLAFYNTADQTTNYERARLYWSSNIFRIDVEKGGTGTLRDINYSINGSTGTIGSQLSTTRDSSSIAYLFQASMTNASAASGTQATANVNMTLNQSGTAGYRALQITTTESATGSGEKTLIYASVGGTQKFRVDNAGLIETASTTMIKSTAAFTNGAAAQVGTLTNAPAAGNPTKWIPINDNGTTRYIPAW